MPLFKGKPSHLLAALSAVLFVTVAGCGAGAGKDSASIERPEPVVEDTPDPQQTHSWPLTGVSAEEAEFGPALSVKIENSPGARPQGGLDRADIVWEQLVEGGMTRFVAMFHSDLPEAIGPVRSVRPMDAAIAGQVGGGLAFSGGQAEYQAKISAAGVSLISHDGGNAGFYRDPNRQGDHRLFGDTEQLLGEVSEAEAPPELFSYPDEGEDPAAARAGSEANTVETSFPASKPSWQWNGEAWQRMESGQAAHAESGAPLEAANVVVIRVEVRDTGNRDAAGSMVPETVLTGSGEAMVFSGGHVVDGTWEKDGDADPLRLVGADGEELTLAPGKTWVELVPNQGGSVKVS